MLLGNQKLNPATLATCSGEDIIIKKAVKILGVYFTYNQFLWKNLNFEETFKSISEKLRFWNWRNLTILGRIQIVKTFAVPILMYRVGLVCMHKDIIMEANKILFNFIWKGKDKEKRSTLITDVEKGGLRAPHLESAIKTRPVGGKLILGCGFDIKKLPIKLPNFYEECFQIFAEHSAATAVSVQCLNNNTIADTIVWNNKHIRVDNKSVFHRSLFEKGISTLEDLVSESNDFIVKQSSNNSHFTPTEVFLLMQVIDALPLQWRNSLALHGQKSDKTSVLLPTALKVVLSAMGLLVVQTFELNFEVTLHITTFFVKSRKLL